MTFGFGVQGLGFTVGFGVSLYELYNNIPRNPVLIIKAPPKTKPLEEPQDLKDEKNPKRVLGSYTI